MKTYKRFNEFVSERKDNEILESIFQETFKDSAFDLKVISKSLNESYFEELELGEDLSDLEDVDDRELTSGEKAALKRDFEIMTSAQMAAIFLKAKERAEEEDGKYTIMIDGIENFGSTDSEGKFTISAAALADAIGLSSGRTVTRTISKFKNLINNIGSTHSESIYPKIKKAFDAFSSSSDAEVAGLASGTIQEPSVTTARDAQTALGDTQRDRKLTRDKELRVLGEKVYQMVKKLGPIFKDAEKAQRQAINKIAKEMGASDEEELKVNVLQVKKAYREYLKGMNLGDQYVGS